MGVHSVKECKVSKLYYVWFNFGQNCFSKIFSDLTLYNYVPFFSYKTQSNQYMDQISTLLKQVAEHTQRNEGLNAKVSVHVLHI